jgi:DNA-binding NarL/FixJ family response regulator
VSDELPGCPAAGFSRIPVWMIDNNSNFCLVLSEALNRSGSVECARYFLSCRHALQELEKGAGPPAVILLDIKMPEMTGVEAIVPLKKLAPSARIIMLTSYDLDRNIQISLKRGASGYLLKSSTPAEIIHAIEAVQKGGAPIDPLIARKVMQAYVASDAEESAYRLSHREQEILRYVAEGLGTAEVAKRLGISHATVDTHVRNIFGKLGVHNRHAMVAKAIRERLI